MAGKKGKSKSGDGSGSYEMPNSIDKNGRISILIEMRQSLGASPQVAMSSARSLGVKSFNVDEEFEPVTMEDAASVATGAESVGMPTYIIRGTVRKKRKIEEIRAQSDVAEVWVDTPIAPIMEWDPDPLPEENLGAAPCPIPPCDCDPGTPKGTMADVAAYLGVDSVWSRGFRGAGIVVGVLDSGITAQGRQVKNGETPKRIPRVIDGWPSDWGTESGKWGNHGNMCATDVLGMAPDAQLYDFRIAGSGGSPGTISRALQAFNWAISRHRVDGTPHILSNSWGIFQETWDTTYARNPNHPFTRKVVEAINEGILVLFAAGNCGDTCPDRRCGADIGPGRSIWGANGHPQVMTVGAVNKEEKFIGYSSRGPAALDPNKPDFCSVSHFTGYNRSDSGTSAATPICAGVVALLKQSKTTLSQDACKSLLKATAKDIGVPGFDQHSGAGIIKPLAAFEQLVSPIRHTLRPPCLRTYRPLCPPPPTIRPPCPLTRRPPCIPSKTFRPPCDPPVVGTLTPPCPIITRRPSCPRPNTLRPPCGRRTLTPVCRPIPFPRRPRITMSAAMCTPVPFSADVPYGRGYFDEYGSYGGECSYHDPYDYDYDYYDQGNRGEYGYAAYPASAYDNGYSAGGGGYPQAESSEFGGQYDYYDPYASQEEWFDNEYEDWGIDDEGGWHDK